MVVGPSVSVDNEPWLLKFPGLGSATVAEDGTVTIDPEPGEDSDLRSEALLYGWADLISWSRRGFSLIRGSCLVPSATSDSGLLLLGGDHELPEVEFPLLSRGWHLVSDKPTPMSETEAGLSAYPRSAPLVAPKRYRKQHEWAATALRQDSNAFGFEVPRAHTPIAIRGICEVRTRRLNEVVLENVTGLERFSIGAHLAIGGILSPVRDAREPDEAVAAHVRAASLPISALRIDPNTILVDVDLLLAWWDSVIES